MVCIRGAITAEENSREEILERTKEMLSEIIERNSLKNEDILSVVFTATKDLTKAYPAVGARQLGLTEASLMCVQEMYVEGSLEKCIRVMVTAENGEKQKDAKHVYLRGAKVLRPDIK